MGQWRQAYTELQKFPRVMTTVPVRISTVDPETDQDTRKAFFRSAEESMANLSRGGAFVPSWEPLAAGRRVVVAIDLQDGRELQLVGRVAWTRRELRSETQSQAQAPGYGIEFIVGSREELAQLDQFLKEVDARTTKATPQFPLQPSPIA